MATFKKVGFFVLAMVLLCPPLHARTVSKKDAEASLMRMLGAEIRQHNEKWRLQGGHLQMRAQMNIPDGYLGWRLQSALASLKPGRQNLDILLMVDNEPIQSMRFSTSLIEVVRVLVTKRSLMRGEMIRAEDLSWKEQKRVGSRRMLGIRDPGLAIGKTVTRAVRAGDLLQARWLDAPMVIKRGAQVMVEVKNGGLRIKTIGIAQSNGKVGDLVTFKNPLSKRRYVAKVMGPGRALVEML
ncbi:flagellar basal body P-ring formation chaperone FlgA [Magnetococcales bacterium HHB-1]